MTDILLTDTYELQVVDGDLVLDASDTQNQQCIVKAEKGNYLEFPTIGVGIDKYLNSNLGVYIAKIRKDIEVNFQLDNYALVDLQLSESSIDFIAKSK